MNAKVVFFVRSPRDRTMIRTLCPDAQVAAPEIDLDGLDLRRTSVVVVGGVDFIGGLVERLRARYLGEEDARFTYLLAPRQAARAQHIQQLLDAAGLRGKYTLIVPSNGFLHAVYRITRSLNSPGPIRGGAIRSEALLAAHETSRRFSAGVESSPVGSS